MRISILILGFKGLMVYDFFFIVSTSDHAATFHRGQGAELQLVELGGLFAGSHLLNAPLQWTARVLIPLPQVTEHYKGKSNLFLKRKPGQL